MEGFVLRLLTNLGISPGFARVGAGRNPAIIAARHEGESHVDDCHHVAKFLFGEVGGVVGSSKDPRIDVPTAEYLDEPATRRVAPWSIGAPEG